MDRAIASWNAFVTRLIRPQKQPLHRPRPHSIIEAIHRYVLQFHALVILFWLWVIYHGEISAFDTAIAQCHWDNWEPWPVDAKPHHLVLLADPQLVDPHTYPGRPWPLSSLTVRYTDRYLKRTFDRVDQRLDPDSIYFLGDLFDGGREWRTESGAFKQNDKRWVRYDHGYWKKEYRRFAGIFLPITSVPSSDEQHRSRKLITSLPGNHDIGLGAGVQLSVRNRFQTFFGESDRVDIIGNHTFVGIDGLSLSAMDVPEASKEIWGPTKEFLDNVKYTIDQRTRIEFELEQEPKKHPHVMAEHVHQPQGMRGTPFITKGPIGAVHDLTAELPTVAMTHVPLFRNIGTPCGPFRERYPPSAPRLTSDEPNAIRIAGGYQYQNVLSQSVTTLITDSIKSVSYAFSGDDHDYCEVTHANYASAGAGIKEVTVKSMSWAMGVRKPGFLLVSMWNPVDRYGHALPESPLQAGLPTLQSQLCILPDQLGIFLRYIWVLVLTTLALAANAIVVAQREQSGHYTWTSDLLPVSHPPDRDPDKIYSDRSPSSSGSGMSSMGISKQVGARARSSSQVSAAGGYGLRAEKPVPVRSLPWQAGYHRKKQDDIRELWTDDPRDVESRVTKLGRYHVAWQRFRQDQIVVAAVVMTYYLWTLAR